MQWSESVINKCNLILTMKIDDISNWQYIQCSKLNYSFFYKSNFGELKLQKWLPDISVGQHYTVQEK